VLVVVVDLDGVLRRWDPAVLAGAEAACGLPAGALGEVAFAPALLSAAVTGRISDAAWREQVVGQLAARFGRAAAVGAVARWSVSAGESTPRCWRWSAAFGPGAGWGCCRMRRPGCGGTWRGWGWPGRSMWCSAPRSWGWRNRTRRCSGWCAGGVGVEPGRCGLVDDTAGHVAAAEAVGLVGHRYVSPAGLVGFLTGRGLWGPVASE